MVWPPPYMSEIFHPMTRRQMTRTGAFKLHQPNSNLVIGQKTLSFIGPRLWNNLSSHLKLAASTNAFKHRLKDEYFDGLTKTEDDIYIYY